MKSPSVQTGLRGWIMSPAESYQKLGPGSRGRSSPRPPAPPEGPSRGGLADPDRSPDETLLAARRGSCSGARPFRRGRALGQADLPDGAGVGEHRLVELAAVVDLRPIQEEADLGIRDGGPGVGSAAATASRLTGRERELVERLPAGALGAMEQRDAG